mgnify:CR=1 FL=1
MQDEEGDFVVCSDDEDWDEAKVQSPTKKFSLGDSCFPLSYDTQKWAGIMETKKMSHPPVQRVHRTNERGPFHLKAIWLEHSSPENHQQGDYFPSTVCCSSTVLTASKRPLRSCLAPPSPLPLCVGEGVWRYQAGLPASQVTQLLNGRSFMLHQG